MANTTKLGLPLIDDNMVADVVRDENALANAIDEKAGAVNGLATLGADGKVPAEQLNVTQPPDATTTVKGIVKLNDAADSPSTTEAATPNAVKKAHDLASTANTTANAANLAATSADGKVDTHSGLTTAHGAVSTATASRIIIRDSAGRAKVAAPSATDDIARKDTVDNAVGTLSSLLTTAKGNTVAAINELFTNANNLKSDWAGVIGSPLLSTDTSAQLKTKTQTIKDTIAANLAAKGQSAVGTETLTALAQKIGQIVTGKQYASGRVTANSVGELTISGLSFVPSIINIRSTDGTYGGVASQQRSIGFAVFKFIGQTGITNMESSTFGTTSKLKSSAFANLTFDWDAYQ